MIHLHFAPELEYREERRGEFKKRFKIFSLGESFSSREEKRSGERIFENFSLEVSSQN